MILITSVAPYHYLAEIQAICLSTWHIHGEVFSLNTADEIEVLKSKYSKVNFVKTNRTVKEIWNKNLISINAFLDFGRERGEDVLLINSDILIGALPDFRQDGITVLTRQDYTDDTDLNKSTPFPHGFDGFFIPNKFLEIFPPMVYGLGNCFFDLSIPYRAIQKEIPVYNPHGNYIFHKEHPTQYSYEEWLKTGRFFKFEFDIPEEIPVPQVVNSVMFKIKSTVIK